MADDKELDADTRRGLRILADSTKARGSEGAARRLYKAADTGRQADYQQAEQTFDALPPEKRSSIQVSAETKAETVRVTKARRKVTPPSPPTADPQPVEFLPWELPDPNSAEGIFRKAEPAKQPKPARSSAPTNETSQDWELGRIPGNPKSPRAAPQQPAAAKPAPTAEPEQGQSWDFNNIPGNPRARAARKPPAAENPPPVTDDDDEGQSWDWQKLPEDPTMRRQKAKAPKNELEALRQEMLRTLKD